MYRLFWFMVAMIVASGVSEAATLTLDNGDTLTGEIVGRTEQGLVLDHEVLGEVTVAKDRVESVAVAAPADTQAPPGSTKPMPPRGTRMKLTRRFPARPARKRERPGRRRRKQPRPTRNPRRGRPPSCRTGTSR